MGDKEEQTVGRSNLPSCKQHLGLGLPTWKCVCLQAFMSSVGPFAGCLLCILCRWSSVNFWVLGSSWMVCITAFALFWHRCQMFLNLTQIKLRGYRLDSWHSALRFSFYHILLHPTVMLVTFLAFFAVLLIMQLNGFSMCIRSPIRMKLLLSSSHSFNPPFQIDALLWLSAIMFKIDAWFERLTADGSKSILQETLPTCIFSYVVPTSRKAVFWFLIVPCSGGSPTETRNTHSTAGLQLLEGICICFTWQNSSGRDEKS